MLVYYRDNADRFLLLRKYKTQEKFSLLPSFNCCNLILGSHALGGEIMMMLGNHPSM